MKKVIKCLTIVSILGVISIPSFAIKKRFDDAVVVKRGIATHRIRYTPTDPYYKGTQKVDNKYQNILYNHIGNMETVWDSYTGKDVLVADIDSGIDINHPDFTNNIHPQSAYFYTEYENEEPDSPYEVKMQVGTQYINHDYDDEYHEWVAHGTNTAGVIAAENDGVGTVGIAYDAELLVIKVDFEDYSINEAIKYAVDLGAKVINMSFGGYSEPYYDGYEKKLHNEKYVDYFPNSDTSMIEGLNYAYNHGVILIAAAGNECTDTHSYPACNDHVIGVGALKENSGTTAASYSNYNLASDTPNTNPSVDVVAPGTVVVPSYSGSRISGHSSYTKIQGTSFSCPVVVGAAAIWKEKNPAGTPDQFESQLYASATDIGNTGWDRKYGYGAVDIEKLILNGVAPIEEIDDEISSFSLNETDISMEIGAEFLLIIDANPSGIPFNATYTSSNPSVAAVNKAGKISALKTGNTTITVQINDLSVNCHVKVVRPTDDGNNGEDIVVHHLLCGGDIVTTSTFLSLTSLLGFFLLKYRKKNKTQSSD